MNEQLKWILSVLCNSTVTIWLGILLARNIRKKEPGFFRFFTTLSNVFAMIGSAVMLPFSLIGAFNGSVTVPHVVVLLKYVSSVSVCVTLLTVLFFLGPVNGYGKLLGGEGFYMHLVGPLLAIVSCCLLEKGWSWAESALGLLPTFVYGTLYFIQVIIRKNWKDFYGFNRGGKWPVAIFAMLTGTALICFGMTVLAV